VAGPGAAVRRDGPRPDAARRQRLPHLPDPARGVVWITPYSWRACLPCCGAEPAPERGRPFAMQCSTLLGMREIRWTDWSEDHIARHGVTPAEVEEVVYARPRLITRGRDEATLTYGTTDSGRYLLVVTADDADGRTAFVVTARDMTTNERTQFRKRAR
jgi:hypothetical protein